jgi:Spy/CpxP family protein refolding chaperone
MTSRGKTRLKIWLVVVGVFVLGCVTGASVDSVYRLRAANNERQEARGGGGRRSKEEVLENMKRDLNLNENQATEIRAILDKTRSDYRTLRTEVRPRYDTIRQNARARIRALLTPEQQQRFDIKAAERDAQRDKEDQDDR